MSDLPLSFPRAYVWKNTSTYAHQVCLTFAGPYIFQKLWQRIRIFSYKYIYCTSQIHKSIFDGISRVFQISSLHVSIMLALFLVITVLGYLVKCIIVRNGCKRASTAVIRWFESIVSILYTKSTNHMMSSFSCWLPWLVLFT